MFTQSAAAAPRGSPRPCRRLPGRRRRRATEAARRRSSPRAPAPDGREQRREIDVEELVAVQREARRPSPAAGAPRTEAAPTPERLGLTRRRRAPRRRPPAPARTRPPARRGSSRSRGRRRPSEARDLVRGEGVPGDATSAFGRPCAASPSRSALPPARMIASTTDADGSGRARASPAARPTASGPADPLVREPGRAHLADRAGSGRPRPGVAPSLADLGTGEVAQLSPLGHDHGGVRAAHRPCDGRAELDAAHPPLAVDDGVPGAYLRSLGEQARREHEARRLSHVVSVRLERQPEQGDRLPRSLPRCRWSFPITRRF